MARALIEARKKKIEESKSEIEESKSENPPKLESVPVKKVAASKTITKILKKRGISLSKPKLV